MGSATVSATAADYLAFNCIATMDDGACSHFLDMRGEAPRVGVHLRHREPADVVDVLAKRRSEKQSNDGVKSSQTTELG